MELRASMELEEPLADAAAAYERQREADVAQYGEVAEVFYEFDADRSGSLDETEVVAYLGSLGLELTNEQHRKALDEMEMDGTRDGLVSLDEFVHWWQSDTATKKEGELAHVLAAAREAGLKPSELVKMEEKLAAGPAALPALLSGGGAGSGSAGGKSAAASRWKKAGLQTRMQLRAVDAFEDKTNQRPSDSDWRVWAYRDWPVWQCGSPIPDLDLAEKRAKRSIQAYCAVVLPAALVLGILSLHAAATIEEHPTCVIHTISRIHRLQEIGWLWIITGGSLASAVALEINSRLCLAKYIKRQRAGSSPHLADAGAESPVAGGGDGGAMRCSAALKVGFAATAFAGSLGYFVLLMYALGLSVVMADVCEGNLLPLLGYVLLLWVWLVCALLTGVPMACFTWLRWHGCNSGDAKALLYPTKYGVPPIPTAPPPAAATKAVRRLPADQRGSAAAAGGGAAEASGSPSPGSERR